MALKIGITGHRKLEDSEHVKKKIQQVFKKIIQPGEEPNFEAFSSLASGSDSLFATEVLRMNGTLKAVLPMPISEYRKDFNTNEAQLLNDLLAKCSNLEIVNDAIPSKSEERNEAYLNAGKTIVNKCDILIAVWDGEKSNGKGGTGDIVNYARKSGKQVYYIQAFRSDISKLFLKYDKKAIHYKTVYEWLWKLSILLSLLAALVLATTVSFKDELGAYRTHQLAKAEFFAVMIALAIILFLKWGKLNKNRITYRRIAERMRVLEKFDTSCINIEKLEDFSDLPQDIVEVELKYQSNSYPENNFERSKESLLTLVEDQLKYHADERPEIKRKTFHVLEGAQFPLLIFFFLGVSAHFGSILFEEHHEHLSLILHQIGLMLSLSIPPIYAAIEGYIYFKEYHKIFHDSEKMKSFFYSVKIAIQDITDSNFDALNRNAFLIMKNMDSENKEWIVLVGQKTSPGI